MRPAASQPAPTRSGSRPGGQRARPTEPRGVRRRQSDGPKGPGAGAPRPPPLPPRHLLRQSDGPKGPGSGAHRPPPLPPRHLLAYERDGFTLARGLLDPAFVAGALAPAVEGAAAAGALAALHHRLRVLAPAVDAASLTTPAAAEAALRRATGGAPGFRQHFNLHRDRTLPAVREALTPLAAVASQLLAARPSQAVRLLSTCAFIKKPGDGPTEWHADGRMAPIDGPVVTAWVPLRKIGPGGAGGRDSGLSYAKASHRDVSLLFFYQHWAPGADLSGRGYDVVAAPAMAPGDVLFHDAWTLHAAGGLPPGSQPRAALSAAFFLDGATLLPPPGGDGKKKGKGRAGCAPLRAGARDDEDAECYADWLPEAWRRGGGGARAEHELLPVVWRE